jgi:hypothetical protein
MQQKKIKNNPGTKKPYAESVTAEVNKTHCSKLSHSK